MIPSPNRSVILPTSTKYLNTSKTCDTVNVPVVCGYLEVTQYITT